ncbi:AHH domain-containing protein [Thalassolituus oleivorans]|jgi:hypothetical protein|uniref:Uncharacterized protein n=1 Tax=Thalassolituus oleivorans MIL-1 TaxID=1298593 RepID=M5DVU1_9GAMM|nr:AHH domain-containing protein [Thalassolituus oleivorans]PCI49443.1 MAG: hypothetical protein COB43_04970 [Oceanospirillales bacterium]PHQ87344.1 MAG: hypothetical protein COB58_05130 [Thalassobium sp.]CCU73522.1 hypothetical protein TOL_3126 [Thalassolituus oleivorans MIL-1]
MELEYRNGVRITKFAHEKSAFEAALDEHERNLKAFYSVSSTSMVEADRKKAVADGIAFLARERAKLSTISQIQDQLLEYRAQGMAATNDNSDMWSRADAFDMLMSEGHHPTADLERNMAAEGIPKPSAEHSAHHICPGKGKIPALTRMTRIRLHTYGVRINDPANGIYLLCKDCSAPHWSMPESRGHRKYHNHDYEYLLWERISAMTNQDQIKTQLQVVGRIMQQNEPKTAIQKMKSGNTV